MRSPAVRMSRRPRLDSCFKARPKVRSSVQAVQRALPRLKGIERHVSHAKTMDAELEIALRAPRPAPPHIVFVRAGERYAVPVAIFGAPAGYRRWA